MKDGIPLFIRFLCSLIGQDDIVRCFYCGGSLQNWDRTQNPFTKHVRCFPDCDYIHKVRGEVTLKDR